MDASRHPELSTERSDEAVAPPLSVPPAPSSLAYSTPELRDYGRLEPRLQFTPPAPP